MEKYINHMVVKFTDLNYPILRFEMKQKCALFEYVHQ